VSAGIDATSEYVTLEADLLKQPPKEARGGPIGLGYRVPMIVASPWSRGGYVNSQVFDHTSVIQLMEKVLSRRTGKPIKETNISAWRRTVCGDLTSAFQPFERGETKKLPYPAMNEFLEGIHKAQFKAMPSGFAKCTAADYQRWMPQQEKGTRPANALPYELHAMGKISGKALELVLAAKGAVGAPFHAYTPGSFRGKPELRTRAYAVTAGQQLTDLWELEGFANGRYHLQVLGPNGYFCELVGSAADPLIEVSCRYRAGDIELVAKNLHRDQTYTLELTDHGYGTAVKPLIVQPGAEKTALLKLAKSSRWYDFTASVGSYQRRFAGRVETGKPGISDPLMGRALS
jgi:phospholipase C